MTKFKKISIFILIPIIVGFIGNLLGNSKEFENIIQPSFTPPKLVFPIAWTILYILMGISSYLVVNSKCECKSKAILLYIVQLSINCIWNLFFFRMKMFLFSFYLIIILIAIVLFMIIYFFKCNKVAGFLQLPYILWLIFASILTYSVYLLN